ncbi:hypothetical protein JOC85_004396 [Bacillus mesophilus]|uniref:Uncharacterized protein n=1 Tax=Bacillus mesophilus TaxID=1808955 RepID=A0A6M0QD47_9BACI|nr:hypothetical protein [Bacillus mesophilus]MBM7663518.1 hypothetical protein [Bacillus mesophilus]NEY74195.1 hypothetical protein [Bacillus mesophilus]
MNKLPRFIETKTSKFCLIIKGGVILKNLSLILSLIFLSIGLLGCQQSGKEEDLNNEISKNVNSSNTQNMPKDMPSDFDFSIQFGVQKKNEINTFEGTVTKDLIADGSATTELILTEEEMKDIYEKMQNINIAETKEYTPEPINCFQEPHGEDEWKIIINGETITHLISGKYCEPTSDAKQLIELRNYVFHIIKSKDEYKSLPESKGGYD